MPFALSFFLFLSLCLQVFLKPVFKSSLSLRVARSGLGASWLACVGHCPPDWLPYFSLPPSPISFHPPCTSSSPSLALARFLVPSSLYNLPPSFRVSVPHIVSSPS
eukprot:gb/GEZN01017043.1/.p2 GENE.gb/GEZN01017043.1/~~gb/GEZN01017043.1/.p2  ORF type:complete len:106 (-),score=17.62 gb/GEZN01017043.1/:123-440(-)